MSNSHNLAAQKRDGVGKGAARAARRGGLVPGVVYGGGETPFPVNVKMNELLKLLKQGRFLSTALTLNVDNKPHTVMPRDVQKNLLNGMPTHVDFLRLKAGGRISVSVPVVFVNQDASAALKSGGGVLSVTRHEVEVYCSPDAIPEQLVADLTGVTFGDVIKYSSLKSDVPVSPVVTGQDLDIASVMAPKAAEA